MRVKTLSSVVAVTGMLLSFAAQAQDAPAGGEATPAAPPPAAPAPVSSASKGIIGADVAVAIPFGNWGDAVGLGFGVLGRGEYNLIPNLNLTGRVGLIYHLAKNDLTFIEVPILVGAKYLFTDQIYGAAEIGAIWLRGSSDAGSDSDTKFGFTIGGGYKMDALDFKLALHVVDLDHAGDSTQLVLSAGYNFAAF